MKNKIIELIKEMAFDDGNRYGVIVNAQKLADKIQDMEFPLTLQEVFEHCNKQYAKNLPDTCYQCKYGEISDDGYCSCSFQDEPGEWDIEKIKAVRHESNTHMS